MQDLHTENVQNDFIMNCASVRAAFKRITEIEVKLTQTLQKQR